MSVEQRDPPTLLTPAEAAQRLRIAPQTLWRYGSEGRVKAVHLTARTLRYTEASVRALMEGAGPEDRQAGPAVHNRARPGVQPMTTMEA